MRVGQTYVNALCFVRHQRLLGWEKLMRLVDAADRSSAEALLAEYGFGEGAEGVAARIAAEEQALADFCREYANPAVAAYTLAPYDFFNAQMAVRAHVLGFSPVFTQRGLVEPADILAYLSGRGTLPKHLAAPIQQAQLLFEDGRADGMHLDTLFARAKFAHLFVQCRAYPLLKRLLVRQVDAANLSVALRANSPEQVSAMFIPGGRLPLEALQTLTATGTLSSDLVRRYDLSGLLSAAVAAKAENQPLVAFEREVASLPLAELLPDRYQSNGITPLVLYYEYKKAECNNVRIILTAKAQGTPNEEITRRLRLNYGR